MGFVEFRDKFVAGVILLVQIALYPVHLLFRILARGLLIVLTVGFVPISLVLVVGFGVGSWDWLETGGWKEEGRDFSGLITLIAFLSVLGVVANFLKRRLEAVRESLLDVVAIALSTVTDVEWLPGLDVKESVRDTWSDDFCLIWPFIKEMCIASRRFVGAAALFLIACTFAYLPIRDFDAWREDVDKNLAELNCAVVPITSQPSSRRPEHPKGVPPAQNDRTLLCPECIAPRPPAVHTGPS